MKPDFTSFRRLADENVVSVGKPHTSNVYVDNFWLVSRFFPGSCGGGIVRTGVMSEF